MVTSGVAFVGRKPDSTARQPTKVRLIREIVFLISRRRAAEHPEPISELETKSQFQVARAAAAEEWIAGTNIRRGRYRKKSDAVSCGIESVLCEINAEIRPQRVGKVGM